MQQSSADILHLGLLQKCFYNSVQGVSAHV